MSSLEKGQDARLYHEVPVRGRGAVAWIRSSKPGPVSLPAFPWRRAGNHRRRRSPLRSAARRCELSRSRALHTFWLVAMLCLAAAPARAQESDAEAGVIIGRLRDAERGQPLGGRSIQLAGTHRQCRTGGDGSFSFSGLAPGYYRPLVIGACRKPLPRIGVVPGDTVRTTVRVDTGCAGIDRVEAANAHGPAADHGGVRAYRVSVAEGYARLPLIDWERSGAFIEIGCESPSEWTVVAADAAPVGLDGRVEPTAGRLSGANWLGVRLPTGCFAEPTQIVVRDDAKAFVRLGCGVAEGSACPVLERSLCERCIDHFFDEIEAARLWEWSGRYRASARSSEVDHARWPRAEIMAGSVAGRPIWIETGGAALAPIAGFRLRLVDFLAYFTCNGDGELAVAPIQVGLEGPTTVRPGELVRLQATARADSSVIDGVLRLLAPGLEWVRGELAFVGDLDAGIPVALEAVYRVPESAGGVIEAEAEFAIERARARQPSARLEIAVIR